ncbi:MAG TPA: SDR family oxidoreductase [Bryobacteraceae bacterium]|nr:SDR family oxidoreductase [Bryobacteraceae bacterium]
MSKVVLITGASTGFGRTAAETLARRGYSVVATMRDIAGRNAANRRELEQFAAAERLRLNVLEMDVTSDASVENAARETLRLHGRADVVINNAGLANIGVTEGYTPDQYRELFETNVFGVVRVNRAVIPAMRRQREGLLLHVSSGAGRLTIPYMTPYCASKFALEAIADAYRFELAPFGIDSVIVEPGIFRTAIHGKNFPPADVSRAAEYGNAEDLSQRVGQTFQHAIAAPDARGAEEVASVFVNLIETPAGQRPLRTLVGLPIDRLREHNDISEELRAMVAHMFHVTELLEFRRGASSAR